MQTAGGFAKCSFYRLNLMWHEQHRLTVKLNAELPAPLTQKLLRLSETTETAVNIAPNRLAACRNQNPLQYQAVPCT